MLVKQMLPRAHERLAVIEEEAPVREAAYLMSKPHTDLVVVCSHGDLVGVVTKTDIVSQISRCIGFGCTTRVESVMMRAPWSCP
jgi:CBS domain-containing protein